MLVRLKNNTYALQHNGRSYSYITDTYGQKIILDGNYTFVDPKDNIDSPKLEVGQFVRVKDSVLLSRYNFINNIYKITKLTLNKNVAYCEAYRDDDYCFDNCELEIVDLTENQQKLVYNLKDNNYDYIFNHICYYIYNHELDYVDGYFHYKIGEKKIKIKPGRLASKLGVSVNNCERFSNFIKALFSEYTPAIVDGEDLLWSYLESNNTQGGGSLNNSCMRHNSKQNVLSFYTENGVKLARIMINNKVAARALIWQLDNDEILLDRVYSCYDFLDNIVIDWAKSQGWIIKTENTSDFTPLIKDGKPYDKPVKYKIQKLRTRNNEYYPFLDTLFKLTTDNYLTNNNEQYGLNLRNY